jgi:hypothetical protein
VLINERMDAKCLFNTSLAVRLTYCCAANLGWALLLWKGSYVFHENGGIATTREMPFLSICPNRRRWVDRRTGGWYPRLVPRVSTHRHFYDLDLYYFTSGCRQFLLLWLKHFWPWLINPFDNSVTDFKTGFDLYCVKCHSKKKKHQAAAPPHAVLS